MTQIDSKLCTVTKKVGNKNTGKNGNTKKIYSFWYRKYNVLVEGVVGLIICILAKKAVLQESQ